MSVLPEIERELLRVAGAERPGRRRSRPGAVLMVALAAVSLALAAAFVVVLHRPASRPANVGGSTSHPKPAHHRPARTSRRLCELDAPMCGPGTNADVDGDGHLDSVQIIISPRYTLHVVRASGGVLNARIPNPVMPAVLDARSVNGHPGAEIFVLEYRISSGTEVGVYAFDGRHLVRAGGLSGGGDSGMRAGFQCSLGRPATIVQHEFVLEGPNMYGRWQRTDITYAWRGARLHQVGKRTSTWHGLPPANRTRFGC